MENQPEKHLPEKEFLPALDIDEERGKYTIDIPGHGSFYFDGGLAKDEAADGSSGIVEGVDAERETLVRMKFVTEYGRMVIADLWLNGRHVYSRPTHH